MKKLLLLFFACSFLCCAPDIPVTEQDIVEMKEKLDQCITNLDDAQSILEQLIEELQECIDKESRIVN